jgi:hypothetical protein
MPVRHLIGWRGRDAEAPARLSDPPLGGADALLVVEHPIDIESPLTGSHTS